MLTTLLCEIYSITSRRLSLPVSARGCAAYNITSFSGSDTTTTTTPSWALRVLVNARLGRVDDGEEVIPTDLTPEK